MAPERREQRAAGCEGRRDPRVRCPAHVFFSAGRTDGRGVLYDLSIKGARIEKASPCLEPETSISLTFSVGADVFPVRIPATVTRRTKTGFAVEFPELPHNLTVLLGRAISYAAERNEEDEDPTEPTLPPLAAD